MSKILLFNQDSPVIENFSGVAEDAWDAFYSASGDIRRKRKFMYVSHVDNDCETMDDVKAMLAQQVVKAPSFASLNPFTPKQYEAMKSNLHNLRDSQILKKICETLHVSTNKGERILSCLKHGVFDYE